MHVDTLGEFFLLGNKKINKRDEPFSLERYFLLGLVSCVLLRVYTVMINFTLGICDRIVPTIVYVLWTELQSDITRVLEQ